MIVEAVTLVFTEELPTKTVVLLTTTLAPTERLVAFIAPAFTTVELAVKLPFTVRPFFTTKL